MLYVTRNTAMFMNNFISTIPHPCGNIAQNHSLTVESRNFLGFITSLSDIFIKGTKKGVVTMRERVNYKGQIKKNSIDKNFWNEFKKRGFKIDANNGGSFHKGIKQAKFNKKTSTSYEVHFDKKTKFNIVSGKDFMKTVAQIEGLVKYKLFK